MRHPVQMGGFRHHRERAGDQRLRCDNARDHGKHDGHVTHAGRHHFEERVQTVRAGVSRIIPMIEHPCALAEITEHKRDFDERPREIDVATANMTHVGIKRFGTGG